MKDEILKHLYDVKDAALAIKRFVEGKTFDDYKENALLQSGVERKFEIVGEALNRIKRDAPEMLDQIREPRSIISFRNILVHGYNGISNRIVWGIIEEDLDNLIEDVAILIKDNDRTYKD